MRILFTGGGSGGHVYPILAVKSAFAKAMAKKQTLERKTGINFLYVGPNGFAAEVFKTNNIKCQFITAGKLRRYFSLLNFLDILKTPLSLIQSLWHVFWFMPDIIFSKGGFGSIAVVLAGWLYKIPIIIHESDSVPGLVNKILRFSAKKIIVSFKNTQQYFPNKKTVLLGNPIREELTQGNKEDGKRLFGLASEKPIVLIVGGSQGAKKINDIILNTLPRLLEKCEIIHICGKKHFKPIINQAGYHLYPFLEVEKLKHAYAASDLIVSRAGAGSIFEISAVGKPSILIPLSSAASNHQSKNAWVLAQLGGALVLKEKNLTINMFLEAVFNLLDNPEKMKEMSIKTKSFYNPTVNQKIAEEILELVLKR